jgi:hypothetical protein
MEWSSASPSSNGRLRHGIRSKAAVPDQPRASQPPQLRAATELAGRKAKQGRGRIGRGRRGGGCGGRWGGREKEKSMARGSQTGVVGMEFEI